MTEKQKRFCEEYIFDWNGVRAYQKVFKDANYNSARSKASQLLAKVNIKEYVGELQKDLEKVAKISRLKVINEYQKLAFTSIADLHNTWIERKQFDELTPEQKAAISEVFTRTRKDDNGIEYEEVRIKLHDKQKALEAISKMLGYNEPEKVEHSGGIVWNETKTYEK